MVFICWSIVRVDELQEQFIEDEGADAKAKTTNASTHSLSVWKVAESVSEADKVDEAKEKTINHAIKNTIAGEAFHEGSDEHT